MNYFFIALLTTSGTAVVLYFLLNKILRIKLSILPLILCAACSLFISMALPKVIVRYADWLGTVVVLAVFSLICAYLLAYFDEQLNEHKLEPETALNLEIQSQDLADSSVEGFSPTLLSDEQTQQDQQLETVNVVLETETVILPYELSCQAEQVSNDFVSIETPIPETFDEQLELAFHLKEQKKFQASAKLFQKVLESNRGSEAAPLVILQIADSLKYAGEYQQAIDLLSDTLCSPDIQGIVTIERQIHELLTELQQLQSEKTGGSNA